MTLITTEDLPYPGIPTADVQAADPGMKAYAEAIQPWLDENPGVKLEQITFDVYDQEALLVAISGGTAPSFYPADVLGDWNEELILATEKSGLAADVTDQVAQNDLEAKLADYCLAIWKTKEVAGRHYALPYGYNCGDGIHYRIDLIKAAGLEEPTVDWTWEDLRKLAKALTTDEIKGIGMQTWGLAQPLVAEGWGYKVLRNRLPAPETSWNWKWDFTTSGEEWAERIAWFRSMMFEDQSILADIAMEDDEIDAQFIQGTVAMANNNSTYHTRSPSPSVELSMSRAADELGKPIEEVFGYVPHPIGNNGFNATSWGQLDTMALNPDLDPTALDKAASLHIYMMGPGFVSQKKAAYEQTNDLRYVWTEGDITPLYKPSELEGIPGTPEEAWGEGIHEECAYVANRPLMPWPHWFIPPQAEAGPSETPMDDARDRWFLDSSEPDIMADLKQMEETMNQQAAEIHLRDPGRPVHCRGESVLRCSGRVLGSELARVLHQRVQAVVRLAGGSRPGVTSQAPVARRPAPTSVGDAAMASAQAEATLVGPGVRADETATPFPARAGAAARNRLVRPAGGLVSVVLGLVPAGRRVLDQLHQRPHPRSPIAFTGLESYVRMWHDPLAMQAFRVTALYAGLTILLTFVVPDHRRHPADGDAAARHSLDDAALVHPAQRDRQHARLPLHVQHPVRHLSVGGDRDSPFTAAAIPQQRRPGQLLDRLSRAPLLRPRVDLHGDAARDPPLVLRGGRDRRRGFLAQDLDDLDPAAAPRHLDAAHLRGHRQLAGLRAATDHDRGRPGGASRTVVLYLYTLLQELRFADATVLGVYLFLGRDGHRVVYRLLVNDDPDAPTRRMVQSRRPRPPRHDSALGATSTADEAQRRKPREGLSMLLPSGRSATGASAPRLVGHRGHSSASAFSSTWCRSTSCSSPVSRAPPRCSIFRRPGFPRNRRSPAWRLAVDLNYRDNLVALRLLDRPLYVFFVNSVFIATFTLAIGIPITSFAAYANSKLQRGAIARWSFIFFIGTLMMPTALTLIPSYS